MDQRAKWATSQAAAEVPLGESVEAITQGLAGWIQRVLEVPPPEPCGEANFNDIPLREWRRAVQEWCDSPFVRRAYGDDLPRGLAMAIGDFDDATLVAFLESMS
jgi:hypothetical protein